MRNILSKFVTLGLFILAFSLFYIAMTTTFYFALINIVLIIIAVFVLLQGCGNMDRELKFGRYAAKTETTNDENPQSNITEHGHQKNKKTNTSPK